MFGCSEQGESFVLRSIVSMGYLSVYAGPSLQHGESGWPSRALRFGGPHEARQSGRGTSCRACMELAAQPCAMEEALRPPVGCTMALHSVNGALHRLIFPGPCNPPRVGSVYIYIMSKMQGAIVFFYLIWNKRCPLGFWQIASIASCSTNFGNLHLITSYPFAYFRIAVETFCSSIFEQFFLTVSFLFVCFVCVCLWEGDREGERGNGVKLSDTHFTTLKSSWWRYSFLWLHKLKKFWSQQC